MLVQTPPSAIHREPGNFMFFSSSSKSTLTAPRGTYCRRFWQCYSTSLPNVASIIHCQATLTSFRLHASIHSSTITSKLRPAQFLLQLRGGSVARATLTFEQSLDRTSPYSFERLVVAEWGQTCWTLSLLIPPHHYTAKKRCNSNSKYCVLPNVSD